MTFPDHTLMDPLEAARAEVERAALHYYHTPQQLGIDNRMKSFVVERCLPYVRGPAVLELGYVDGLWTDRILQQGHRVDIVEGASRHVAYARERYAGRETVRVFHVLFQEFKPQVRYDSVVAGDMIRYLPDPLGFLQSVRDWLRPDGRVILTVPNGRSLHRRIGALMNLERAPMQANQRDREVGNLRSYDRYEVRDLLLSAGFKIQALHGCFLKPLSSAQMADWSDDLLRAFLDIGQELEDYCWFIYAVCERP